jgi:two-component system chemotaxis response regulator CheY
MGQQAMVIESIQAGARDFVVKPFQADRVIEAVKKIIG